MASDEVEEQDDTKGTSASSVILVRHDHVRFLRTLEARLGLHSPEYAAFRNTLHGLKTGRLSEEAAVARIEMLLTEHPDLLSGFRDSTLPPMLTQAPEQLHNAVQQHQALQQAGERLAEQQEEEQEEQPHLREGRGSGGGGAEMQDASNS